MHFASGALLVYNLSHILGGLLRFGVFTLMGGTRAQLHSLLLRVWVSSTVSGPAFDLCLLINLILLARRWRLNYRRVIAGEIYSIWEGITGWVRWTVFALMMGSLFNALEIFLLLGPKDPEEDLVLFTNLLLLPLYVQICGGLFTLGVIIRLQL